MFVHTKGLSMRIFFFILSILIFSQISFCKKNHTGCLGTAEECGPCKCSNGIMDCKRRGLTKIPSLLPRNLKELDLTGNNISFVGERSINNCRTLKLLRLSRNNISHIPRKFFRDIPIKSLYLDENRLNITLSPKVLSKLAKTLMILDIHENSEVPHSAFNNLSNLEELHLDGNLSDGFGTSFSTLKRLKILKINKDMKQITNSTFINFENITTLKNISLREAGVSEVEDGAFKPLKALRSLDLSYNFRLNFSLIQKFLDSVSDDLEELILTGLYDGRLSQFVITNDFFEILGRKKCLKTLKLDKNKLVHISNVMPFYTRSVRHLDLSKNHLQDFAHWPGLYFMLVNLTYINFDDQDQDPCDNILGDHPTSIQSELRNSECHDVDIKKIRPCKFPDRTSMLTSSGVQKTLCITFPRELHEIFHSNSLKIHTSKNFILPPVMIFGNCNVRGYFYRNNGIKIATGPVMIFRPNVRENVTFDFGKNGLTCFTPKILKNSIERGLRVDRLILDENELSFQLETDSKTFAVYSNLTELNIAKNSLKTLYRSTFHNLVSLKILNLSSNYLVSISFDVSHLKNLRVMDLTNNRLVTIESDALLVFSSLKERGYGWLKLILEGNALTCSCENLDFMDWIARNDTLIENVHEIKCKYLGYEIYLTKVKTVLFEATMSCRYATPLIISGVLLSLLIICTLVGTIAYKYRWDVRYYLIKRSQRLKRYQMLLDEENDYIYDAFVSYEMNDRSFIVQELMSKLEQQPPLNANRESGNDEHLRDNNYSGITNHTVRLASDEENVLLVEDPLPSEMITFRLCIHERDFELGNEIEANILKAIQTSRMVILVVSNHFVQSKWCRLELELAKMESLERGRNIVVAVLLEPIQETLESLEWFMKRYTYLEWFKCDTKSKKDEFWKRMKLALEGNNKKIVCQCGGRRLIDD